MPKRKSPSSQWFDATEQQIDMAGMEEVLYALAEICEGKADHIVTNWQDRPLAAKWSRLAGKLQTFAASGAVQDVS